MFTNKSNLQNPMLLLFAGGDITDVYNDLHKLDTETMVWHPCKTTGQPPSPRAGKRSIQNQCFLCVEPVRRVFSSISAFYAMCL